jgi:hypothetical protein
MEKNKDTRPALNASERRVIKRGRGGGLKLCQNGGEQLRQGLNFRCLYRCRSHIAATSELANAAIAMCAALLVLMVVALDTISGRLILMCV